MVICAICNKEFNTPKQLSWHVKHHSMNNKQYYDKYIKKSNEGYCLTCGKPTSFISMNLGYHQHCNKKCTNIDKNIQIKRFNTNLDKYGYTTSFSTRETQGKVKQTILNKYGVYNPFMSDEIKDKIKNTNIKRYGVENPQQNREIHVRTMKHYKYDSVNFDSSWELAVYIYCMDHNIYIKREPIKFSYINAQGKKSYYFPDFMINNNLVEIKGDQFLDKDGTLKDKYKLKCMNEYNVKIWLRKDVQKYIDYCINKFNDKYWYRQFK